jgi:ABC-2 type transport system ATP-binding protein
VAEAQAFGDRLHVVVHDASAVIPALRARLRGAGVEVASWRVVPPSLENVFISLLKTDRQTSPTP